MKHNGAILEKAVRNADISITELSRRLHVNRKTLYNWFSQPQLKVDVFYHISREIHYDFSGDLVTTERKDPLYFIQSRPSVKREHSPRELPDTDAKYWEEKYNRLLEQYNEFLNKTEQAVAEEVV